MDKASRFLKGLSRNRMSINCKIICTTLKCQSTVKCVLHYEKNCEK